MDAVAIAAGITAKQATAALDAVAAVVRVGLSEEGQVTIGGVGRFVAHRRRERRIRNPATGVMMDLPAKTIVKFKPSSDLRESVEERT